MQQVNEKIINVQEIEPRLRHLTIFQTFDGLGEGESLIIHNNHDPRPVYYQLMEIRGDVFTWDYLQQGPEWWDIRVTKKVAPQHNSTGRTADGELVINVPSIEPRLKHATIFQAFEELNPGESFIIHNDHDPKPLYYQLADMYGDIFTWTYLQQGPQWWDIRVAMNANAADNSPETGENELVINVPAIADHRLKHATILKAFDNLKAGESFIIHNDHDPKPVYYQLQGIHGDVFTWAYLQQGPQWWDIRVTRKGNENEETIGQIVAKDISKIEVFKKFGIDFCCGGEKTIREACAEKGIDPKQVEQELVQPVKGVTAAGLNFNEWDLDFLADYVVNKHHKYIRKYMPEIKGYAAKVAKVHGGNHPELLKINELVVKMDKELHEHIAEEENILFPAIKEIVNAKNTNAPYARKSDEHFKNLVTESESEHDSVGDAMKEIDKLSDHYTVPADGCTSYKLLFKMLEELEEDLFVHIHLENNILFPKSVEMEKSLL